ncbi:RNA polymerase subunit sigma-70 [Amycolatopsis sp. SID8362]|uniref:RNA polymerase subunit sigma-70 n=1 Tax=Amycolatopsis sp. SID8362 TaxID=2690346 RepID=UPI00136901E8|nr:RNA polymerase subunit sigma-70 [Amycolatopsis sp. SID8362]NBH01742.1 sigma-70 family RNA polymerase sigma factor [Amycolatopsis sp. SID8362]NED38443.1 sigma-70 family RNA polymerase sigma factor [Amycolatopsis sp. SID8362]
MTAQAREAADQDRFAVETERFRRELVAHCYRMVGSAHEAEDLVQETYLRAWRSYAGFEGRASVRAWLYKIATNVCLTALESRRIRVLPSGLAGPDDGSDRPPSQVEPGAVSWLEPLPDRFIAPAADDPAAAVIARESLRLALVASLQHLPARQRAILLLREVLAFSAVETAKILGTTTAAVKSGLQRARARLDGLEPTPEDLLEPTDQRARALLDGYIAAFERSDARLLEQVLRADASLEATPFREWYSGRVNCIRLLDTYVLGAPGVWRMIATTANAQPAAAVYHRGADGALQAHGIVVLTPTATGFSRVVEFHDPALVVLFGFPAQLTD